MKVPIKGFEGLYSITRSGRIWSNISKKYLTSFLANGYLSVGLKGGSRNSRVHRFLATAFIPNPENKPQVNHKNGIKTDNRIENLEWCTSQENTKHAYKLGLRKPNRKLNEIQVKEIRELRKAGMRFNRIAEKYGVHEVTISLITRNKRYVD